MGFGKGKGGCGIKGIMKLVLVIVNTVITIAGIALFIVGAIAYFGKGTLTSTVDVYSFITNNLPFEFSATDLKGLGIEDLMEPVGIAAMALGAVMAIVAIVGCCGAKTGLKVLLIVYGVAVLILLLAQIAILIALFGFDATIKGFVKTKWKETITNFYAGDQDHSKEYGSISLFWTAINRSFKCCGVDSGADFAAATKWSKQYNDGTTTHTSLVTPVSCCLYDKDFPGGTPQNLPTCAVAATDANSYTNVGCWSKIEELLKNPSDILMYVFIGIIGVQFLLMVFAFILACKKE